MGWRTITALAAVAILAGCVVGPDFVPPNPPLPETSFTNDARDKQMPLPTDPLWWASFRDPILTSLANRVAASNLDVQTATVRLAESRFQRGITAAALFPSVNGSAKYTRELYSKNGILSLLSNLLTPAQKAAFKLEPINEYNVGLDASWELDLWGRVRRQVESADAQIDQSAEQQRAALVSSIAEVARDYIQLRGVQTQIRIANENLKIDRDILDLVQERQKKGVANGLDVERAAAQVESIRAQIPALQQQEVLYINALSLLLGQEPGALKAELGRPRAVPPAPLRVPVGLPSDLARRRPDIRAAEAQLHAATADIGVAIGAFYPSVQLNGTIGFDLLHLNNLFSINSLQYTVGPTVTLPIFAGGRLKSTLELRKTQQIEAAIAYHKTVLQAWHEVVNAMISYRLERERRGRLQAQMEHSRTALSLARERYTEGVSDFLTVLDAERSLLDASQQHATSNTNVSLYLVQLFKALGGGWELTLPVPVPVPAPTLESKVLASLQP